MAKIQLPDNVVREAAALHAKLQDAITDLQEAVAARPQRWRDGEEGTKAAAWLETLQNLTDDLENLDYEPR